MNEDDLSEEEQRKIAAQLLQGKTRSGPRVEVRRSGNKKAEPVELRFVNCVESFDGTWVWCEVEQKASAGWFKIETYDNLRKAEEAAEKYARAGDKVSWWRKEI